MKDESPKVDRSRRRYLSEEWLAGWSIVGFLLSVMGLVWYATDSPGLRVPAFVAIGIGFGMTLHAVRLLHRDFWLIPVCMFAGSTTVLLLMGVQVVNVVFYW